MIDYEWCAWTTEEPDLDLSQESAFDGCEGCTVSELKQAIAWVKESIEQGGDACVVLVRYDWRDDSLDERVQAYFRPGEEAPAGLHWEFLPCWKVPKRFIAQWNRHGAGEQVKS